MTGGNPTSRGRAVRRALVAALLATAVGVGAAGERPAHATVLQALDFDTQCDAAAQIFVATVHAVESRRNAARPRFFETIVTFAVEEMVVGSATPEVMLRFAGGRIGDEVQSIDGMPELAVGERYVVFAAVREGPPLVSPIVGFNQGLYRVVAEESAGGVRLLVRDHRGRPLTGLHGVPAAVSVAPPAPPRGAAVRDAEPELAAFLAAVRAARLR